MAGQLSASAAVSPYSSYSSHGTSTIASPQPAEPFIFSRNPVRSATGIGAMLPRLPSAHCSTTRSRSHFTEKPRDVVEVRRRRDVELPVTRPSRALARRAVGRDVARVAAERPHRRRVQPVDAVVAAREGPARRQVGVHHDPGDVVGGERAGMPLDPHVLEPVRRQPRLEDVPGHSRGHDDVDLARAQRLGQERRVRAQVLHRHVAVRAERLTVRQRDPGAGRAEGGQPHPAVDVLAEVDHEHAFSHRRDRHRAQLLDGPHGRGGRADEGVVPSLAHHDRRPDGLVGEQPAVLVLALDQVGLGDVRRRPAPRLVGADDGGGAVLVLEVRAARGTPSRCPTGRGR